MDSSSDDLRREIHDEAHRRTEALHYSLDNPYTTREEKVEVEAWYQLPYEVAGHVLVVCSILWAYSLISGWIAYGIATLVGVLVAVVLWITYSRSWVIPLFFAVRLPFVGWLIHLGVAAWLAIEGGWGPAVIIVINRILFGMLVGFPAAAVNKILSRKYGLHPKYAFLKHVYGKTYPFEVNIS